jgi:hypothetical protein
VHLTWGLAEQGAAADAFQRPLRVCFQQRLRRSVDMTSEVKSYEQTFLGRHEVF